MSGNSNLFRLFALFSFFRNTVDAVALQAGTETHIVRFTQRSPAITGFPPVYQIGFSDERSAHGDIIRHSVIN